MVNTIKRQFSTTFFAIIMALLFCFLIFQVYLKTQTNTSITSQITPLPTLGSGPVVLDNFKDGNEIKSPLIITGKVDSSWMFEGVFRVKLLDVNKKLIVQTQAKEINPGSWMQPGKIPFMAEISFNPKSSPAFLVFEADNPSGLPQNDKSFTVSVKVNDFDVSNESSYQCPPNGWIDCMPIVAEDRKYQCQQTFISWAKINCPNFQGVAL